MFKINADEKREKVEIMTEENKSLRQKIIDLDDEGKRLKKQLKTLQVTIGEQNQLQLKVTQL